MGDFRSARVLRANLREPSSVQTTLPDPGCSIRRDRRPPRAALHRCVGRAARGCAAARGGGTAPADLRAQPGPGGSEREVPRARSGLRALPDAERDRLRARPGRPRDGQRAPPAAGDLGDPAAVGRADASGRGRPGRADLGCRALAGSQPLLDRRALAVAPGRADLRSRAATTTSTRGSASSSTAASGSSSTTSSSRRAPTPRAVVLAFDGARRAAARRRRRPGARRRRPASCGCDGPSSTRRRAAGGSPIEGGYVLDGDRVRFRVAAWDRLAPARHRPGPRLLDVPRRRLERPGLRHRRGRRRQRLRHRHDDLVRLPGVLAPGCGTRGRRDRRVRRQARSDRHHAASTRRTWAAVATTSATRSRWTPTAMPTWPARRPRATSRCSVAVPGHHRGAAATRSCQARSDRQRARLLDVPRRQRPRISPSASRWTPLGNAYVTGSTASADVPQQRRRSPAWGPRAPAPTRSSSRSTPTGATLGYCRFIGGTGDDSGQAIAADATGNVWVVGSTTSTNLAAAERVPVDVRRADATAFVGRLDADRRARLPDLSRRHRRRRGARRWPWTPPATPT